MKGFPGRYLFWTLAINLGIVAVAFWKGPEIYPVYLLVCYAAAALSALCFGFCVTEIFAVDFDPRPALAALFLHGTAFILVFAAAYRALGLVRGGKVVEADFPPALYFSIVTWTTLGYGDFAPREQIRLLAAFEAGVGMIVFGLFLGVAVSWINRRMNETAE